MMSASEYKSISRLVYEKFGIDLGANKRTLVENRLAPVINQLGFINFQEYYAHIISDKSGQSLLELANRLTTNYSFFFRELEHLERLKEILPTRLQQTSTWRNASLSIWSAGCSGGEEPYSLSIILKELSTLHSFAKWDLGILGTDIDTNKLKEAHRGIYPTDRLRAIPSNIRTQYFKQVDQLLWQVKESTKQCVHLSRFNLMEKQFNFKGKFFIIFCRNVMIYFNRATIKTLIQRFYEVTEDGGYLFIGLTESLDKKDCPYDYIAPSVYQKRVR